MVELSNQDHDGSDSTLISSTVFLGNSAINDGDEIYLHTDVFDNEFITLGNVILSCGTATGVNTGDNSSLAIISDNNISINNPSFLSVLANNGGFVETMAIGVRVAGSRCSLVCKDR